MAGVPSPGSVACFLSQVRKSKRCLQRGVLLLKNPTALTLVVTYHIKISDSDQWRAVSISPQNNVRPAKGWRWVLCDALHPVNGQRNVCWTKSFYKVPMPSLSFHPGWLPANSPWGLYSRCNELRVVPQSPAAESRLSCQLSVSAGSNLNTTFFFFKTWLQVTSMKTLKGETITKLCHEHTTLRGWF